MHKDRVEDWRDRSQEWFRSSTRLAYMDQFHPAENPGDKPVSGGTHMGNDTPYRLWIGLCKFIES